MAKIGISKYAAKKKIKLTAIKKPMTLRRPIPNFQHSHKTKIISNRESMINPFYAKKIL